MHTAEHITCPLPLSRPLLPTPAPHRLLWAALPRAAHPPPLSAHRAISLPSFQYFLLVVLLGTKSRGDSTTLCLTSSFLPLAWPDRAAQDLLQGLGPSHLQWELSGIRWRDFPQVLALWGPGQQAGSSE